MVRFLRCVQRAVVGVQVAQAGVDLGLDRGHSVAGGQLAVAVPGESLGCLEQGRGLLEALLVDADEGVPGDRGCLQVGISRFLAGACGERVALRSLGVTIPVE